MYSLWPLRSGERGGLSLDPVEAGMQRHRENGRRRGRPSFKEKMSKKHLEDGKVQPEDR